MKKDLFNLRLKSKLLLFSLFALLAGGVSPAWADAKTLPYSYGFESDGILGDGWTLNNIANNNQSYVKVSTTSAKTGSYGYQLSSYNGGTANQLLISPELSAPNGVILTFAYKSSNSGSYGTETFRVGYSTTDTQTASFTWGDAITESSGSWKVYENTFPAGTKYIAVNYTSSNKYYLYVDDFEFEGVANGPALKVFDGEIKMTSGQSYDFGLATSSDTKTYILKNPGTESVTLTIEATNGFDVSPTSTTIAAKGEETLTITMADATATGTVTISGEGIDDFVINVSGTVRDPNRIYLDFADGQMPEGWTAEGYSGGWTTYSWTVSTGYISYSASSSSYAGKFTSPLLTFAKDELIAFETAKYGSSTSNNPSITVEYSLNGTTWTAIGTAFTDDVYGTWTKRSVTIPVEGVKYIRFNGWYIHMRNIYGGQMPDGAKFAIATGGVDITESTATQSFGVAVIGGIAEKTFTITNSGNAALPVTFTDDTDFYVAKKIMFTKPAGWSSVNLYVWNSSDEALNGSWPGQAMAFDYTNDFGQDVYSAYLPKDAAYIIFSNDGSSQTSNISTEGFKQVIAYYLNGSTPTQWKNDDFSVPAKSGSTNGTASFTIRMATATAGAKSGNIELAFDALNKTDFTIPVSGVVMPADATVVDFNDNKLPTGWGNNASYKWNFDDGKAYCTSAAELTTPQLQFSEGDFFIISATSYDDYDNNYIEVYTSTDGSTWEANPIKKFVSRSQIPYGSYASLVVSDIPTNVKYLKFKGYYVRIDEIVGLKFYNDAPVLGNYTDENCTVAASATEAKDFGFVTEAPTAQVYYIKNDGTGTMKLSLGGVPTGFTALLGTTSLGKDAKTTLTIGMDAESKGYHNGNVVVTAKNSSDEEIGTFTVTSTGVMMEDGKNYVNFATANSKVPTGWTANSWSVTQGDNGYIYSGTSSNELITTTMTAAAGGEKLVITASGNANAGFESEKAVLKVYTKTGDDDWSSVATDLTSKLLSTDKWYTMTVDVPEGNNLIKFEGKNVYIQRIYGLTAVPVAVMATTAADIAFGMQIAESAEKSFTITNDGDAELTGLTLGLDKTGDDAEYSFRMTDSNDDEFTGTTLASGATINVYVKQLYDANKLGSKSDVLTIAATDQTAVKINLTGATRDGSKLYVDFADNNWPAGWQHGNWSVSYGEAISTTDYSSIVTTPLTVAAGDKLSFDVKRTNSSDTGRDLIVRYTTDGGVNWTTYDWSNYDWSATEKLQDQITGSYNTFEIVNIPVGTVAFEFSGKYVRIDNIQADYKLATGPLVTFKETANNIDGANLKADATATYTLANNGNADYVATVATEKVTAEITGDDVTYEGTALTIPAGKTANITVTMAFAAPYGEKTGNLSITSESWVGDITVDYTANLVDPTAFVEDFAAGKPAGWYNGGWTISGGDAHIWTGTAKELITEKLGVDTGKDVLSFDAKVYTGSDEQTLNVYTSTDRETWSAAQTFTLTSTVQSFSLTALTADSYVKFEATNASIDNLTGLKKLDAPAHDLYEVSHTMAATGIPGASYTATMTAVSLRAEETMTAELWLKKGENVTKVTSLENEAMTVDVPKTFTLTGNLPAEEGEYKMWITIKNSDNSAYINTDETDFTIAHTISMAINNFDVATSPVQADDNNNFVGTYNVTVQNTGSKTLAADEISISLINDKIGRTTAASSFVFVTPGAYTGDDAVIAIWNWSDETDGEWVLPTNMGTGLYTAELMEGKQDFSVVRLKPSTSDGYDTENGGINWNNKWNESEILTTKTGNNVFEFESWGSPKDNFNKAAYTLAADETVVLPVYVTGTLTDGENGEFATTAEENIGHTQYGSGLTRTLSVTAAPVIVLNESGDDAGTIASTGKNRKVTLNRNFVAGWNTVCLPFAISSVTGFFGEGAYAYDFTDYNDTEGLTFEKVDGEMTAAKPYLIYVPSAISAPIELTGVEVVNTEAGTTTNGKVSFIGTYAPIAANSTLVGKYVVGTQNGQTQIFKATDKTTMKGFRAYFNVTGEGARLSINLVDDTQGIQTIMAADEIAPEGVYNLNGQKVEQLKKGGLYIINGRKQVVK